MYDTDYYIVCTCKVIKDYGTLIKELIDVVNVTYI